MHTRNHRKPKNIHQFICWYGSTINLILWLVLALVAIAISIDQYRHHKNDAYTYANPTVYRYSEQKELPVRLSYDCNVNNDTVEKSVKLLSEQKLEKIYPDITLSAELQHYAQQLCKEHTFSYPIFIALMWKESTYNPSDISADGMDYGICQIRKSNFTWIRQNLGNIDFMNAKQNMEASMFMLDDIRNNYKITDIHQILMYYNYGPNIAKNKISSGVYSSQYSRAIVNYASTNLGYSY